MRSYYPKIKELGAEVAVVMMGNSAQLGEFLRTRNFPFPVYGNAGVTSYRAYGLKRFTETGAYLDPLKSGREMLEAFSSFARNGSGIPDGDIAQLGGTFVVDKEGKILFAFRQQMASEPIPITQVIETLKK